MAVVSLGNQRVTIYDADGWIMRAPVSSGRKGYETPAGIYAVIQKEAEHYSNLYEDGYMPFMQRITWSGIALHGGPLPGYPGALPGPELRSMAGRSPGIRPLTAASECPWSSPSISSI